MAFIAIAIKKIDLKGGLSGIALSHIIWLGGGEIVLLALFAFFVFGTLASAWKKEIKSKLNLYQENEGKRSVKNVLSNGGVAGIISFIAFIIPEYHMIFFIMAISSFAAACSDTLSSEFGNVYGNKYHNIINWKRSNRGIDGVVSLEGLGFGILGSCLIAIIPMFFHLDFTIFFIISFAGFSGNIMDSILGATLQQKKTLNNHSVNFLATFFSAVISLLLFQLWT